MSPGVAYRQRDTPGRRIAAAPACGPDDRLAALARARTATRAGLMSRRAVPDAEGRACDGHPVMVRDASIVADLEAWTRCSTGRLRVWAHAAGPRLSTERSTKPRWAAIRVKDGHFARKYRRVKARSGHGVALKHAP